MTRSAGGHPPRPRRTPQSTRGPRPPGQAARPPPPPPPRPPGCPSPPMRVRLGSRAQLCFQSRVGPQKWLGPYTEEAIDRVAESGQSALVVCPVAFTGEHIETLQEIDILYRQRAADRGIKHWARARTVGVH